MAAGERPGSMGLFGQPRPSRVKRVIVVALVLLIILPIVGYFTVPAVRSRIDGLINDAAVAIALFQNPSGNAVDSNVASFWLADPADGIPSVRVNLDKTTNLAGMTFQGGATPGAEFQKYGRPRQVEIVFFGEGRNEAFELKDDPAPQVKCLTELHLVQTFEIRILSVYEPPAPGQDLVALREVAFTKERCP